MCKTAFLTLAVVLCGLAPRTEAAFCPTISYNPASGDITFSGLQVSGVTTVLGGGGPDVIGIKGPDPTFTTGIFQSPSFDQLQLAGARADRGDLPTALTWLELPGAGTYKISGAVKAGVTPAQFFSSQNTFYWVERFSVPTPVREIPMSAFFRTLADPPLCLPEPSSFALAGAGVLRLGRRRRFGPVATRWLVQFASQG